MSSVVRNKKIIMSWNSYENMFKHMDMHDLYLVWQFDQIDALNLTSIDNSPISVSWWCEQEMLSTEGDSFPPWTPELDGFSIRIEILIPEEYVESFLAEINKVSTVMNQTPDSIEVTDYTA